MPSRSSASLTSTYDASFGRNGGGQVNVVTKAGSNRLAGTAYEFFRNGALDEPQPLRARDEPEPDYNRNQFGGSIGGPIAANRLFFFGDYEGTRLSEGITRVTNVPTLAERQGDFSQSLFRAPGQSVLGQPFPGGAHTVVLAQPDRHGDGGALSPAEPQHAVRQLRVVAVAAATTSISSTRGSTTRWRRGPLDAALQLRRSRACSSRSRAPASRPCPDSATTSTAAARTWWSRYSRPLGTRSSTTSASATTASPSGSAAEPADRQRVGRDEGAGHRPARRRAEPDRRSPASRRSGRSTTTRRRARPTRFSSRDTATWARGAHLIKFGGEWYGVRQSAFRDVQARGFLTFVDQGYTGNALADLLLGLPVLTGGAQLDNPQNLRAADRGASSRRTTGGRCRR